MPLRYYATASEFRLPLPDGIAQLPALPPLWRWTYVNSTLHGLEAWQARKDRSVLAAISRSRAGEWSSHIQTSAGACVQREASAAAAIARAADYVQRWGRAFRPPG